MLDNFILYDSDVLSYEKKNKLTFMFNLSSIIHTFTKKIRLQIFVTGWLGLVGFGLLLSIIFSFVASIRLPEPDYLIFISSNIFLTYINFSTYFLIFSILLILIKDHWLSLLKSFFDANQLLKGFFYGFLVLTVNIFIGLIFDFFNLQATDNNNQTLITNLVLETPVLSFITFVFLGPIVEEFTYRLGLFSFIHEKNKILSYIVTVLVFGFIHFDFTSANLFNELLNMPFYLTSGLVFCLIFVKENFAVVTYAHITNNLISILSILLVGQLT
jgi:membrane protease YdiL (CAAX protease family)